MRDVVVVGAGPGGSATAHFLAQAGADVLLVDKFEFPRDKTCGDGLTPRALRLLGQMGILPEVTRHGCQIQGYEVVAPNSSITSSAITGPYGALVVPRRILDDIVRQRATQSGAEFARMDVRHIESTPQSIVVRSGRDSVEARTAVVATGAATGVLMRSGILRHQPRVLRAARAYISDIAVKPVFQLRFDRVPWPGYGWVFPVGVGAANVGVGFVPRGRRSPTARAAFDRFVAPLRARAQHVEPPRAYPIRVDYLTAPTFAERTLLVGEAAGLVNPLTGEGIDYALESGAIAAQHILRDAQPAEYAWTLRNRFEKLFRFSTQVRDWYCVPAVLNVLVPLASRRPVLRQMLTEIVLGEREPAGYGPLTTLARLLVYLIRKHGG